MEIGVIGTGAVGGVIAALLDRAGHDVEVTARGATLAGVRERGITLTGAWGTHAAPLTAQETLTRSPELAVVATKASDAAAAIAANATWLDGTTVVVVQNGLGGVRTAEELLPRSRIVGGLALFAASYLEPGEVAVTTPGSTCLGGADPAAARAARDVLGTVMPVTVTDNFAGAQWTKLVVNQINALPAITGTSAQDVIANRGLRRIMTRAMRENVRVGLAAGVRFAPLQGLSGPLLRGLALAPVALGQLVPLLMRRRMGAVPNPGSTLQSLRRGQLTEIDHLNGAVVAEGHRLGVPTPVNAALVDLVHEVERTREHLAPAAVIARIP